LVEVEADDEPPGELLSAGVSGTGSWPDMQPSQFRLMVTVLLPPIHAHSFIDRSNS
jgi:hypothetical protein